MSLPLSQDVYHWPEFKALCERLGIPWDLRTTRLVIDLNQEGLVKVTQEYHCIDTQQEKPTKVETTTLHNKEWRTFQPIPQGVQEPVGCGPCPTGDPGAEGPPGFGG